MKTAHRFEATRWLGILGGLALSCGGLPEQSLTEQEEMDERTSELRARCTESTLRAAVKEGGPRREG